MSYQPIVTNITPNVIKIMPILLNNDKCSPKKIIAKTVAITTLSLSTGAT